MCHLVGGLRTVFTLPLLILLSWNQLWAQNYSVYNSFYVNPYLYNPAEAASPYAFAFANYRKQWLSVEGAPTIATLNYNTLIDHSRNGIGVRASSYSRGLLNTSEALVTYTYGVPFNRDNILYFGISGGATSNTIDASKASDPNDPALANYPTGVQPSANFGLRWASTSGISLGAALPQLWSSVYQTNQPSKAGFAPFNNMLFTFSYRKELQNKIISRSSRGARGKLNTTPHYAPLEFYSVYRYSTFGNNQVEVVGKYNLTDNFWFGLGYRQQYGVIPSIGFLYDQFIFCYSYEMGGQPQKGFSSGSHELQIGLRLSSLKEFKFSAPVLHSTLKSEAMHHDPRFRERTTDQEEAARPEDKKRYYVYLKSFATFDQAEDFKKKIIAQKYNGQIYFHARNKQYYVYTYETTNATEANLELKNLKAYTKLKDAKLLSIVEK
jgi:type IX secretion system PorP/SprF family membrane protein